MYFVVLLKLLLCGAYFSPFFGKEIVITTRNNSSGRSNGIFTVITSGTTFPTIVLECGNESTGVSVSVPNIQGPVKNEAEMKKMLDIGLGFTRGINFGVCSADGTWSVLPECFLVEEVALCGNKKGIFCGSIDSFEHEAVRKISIPDGDGVSISLQGTAKLDMSDYEGVCYDIKEEDSPSVFFLDEGQILDVIYPKYESSHWSITLMNEGDSYPGCTTCGSKTCEIGSSSFDLCVTSSPSIFPSLAPSISSSPSLTNMFSEAPSDLSSSVIDRALNGCTVLFTIISSAFILFSG